MNLFIYTGATRLNAAVVESATDLTPVARLPDLIVGDSEPVTVKFLSASGAFESWSGGGTYTLSVSIGTLGADGIGAYFQTSSFTAVTNGWTGRLNLASGSLPSAVAGYLADRPGAQSVPLFLQVRVTDADGNTETYARQAVAISGAVSVPTTANSTPVTYATAADVAADAATASAAAIAATASASAASGSASTAAGHVTTAGNSATAAAASAVTAGNSATTAAGSATTATTQATNAATSSSDASTYKDAAAVSAASATSSAGTATTQAALATTNGAAQVTLAAAQVTLATTQAGNASTSATAAGVSAAAALVSEAAALVSKNAAAASAATASAVSGSGNGTFSAAALTGVTSVTAPAALTLAGGTSGASLVLGASSTGGATLVGGASAASFHRLQAAAIAFGVNTFTKVALGTSNGSVLWLDNGGATSPGVHFYTANNTNFGIDATNSLGLRFVTDLNETAGAVKAVITRTGNLLIGTTTDMSGSGGLKLASTTASTSTTTGSGIFGGGIGVAGAVIAGGTNNGASEYSYPFLSSAATIGGFATYSSGATANQRIWAIQHGSSVGDGVWRLRAINDASSNGSNAISITRTGDAVGTISLGTTSAIVSVLGTTASTNTTSGALVVTGGVGVGGAMNVGAASVFGGDVNVAGILKLQPDTNNIDAGGWKRANFETNGPSNWYAGATTGASTPQHVFKNRSATTLMTLYGTGNADFAGAVGVTAPSSQSGISIDGTTYPEFAFKTGGVKKVYATYITTNNGIFSGSLVGDLSFRSDSGAGLGYIFGTGTGGALLTLRDSGAAFAGAVSLSTAGTTVSIKSGTNAAAGTVTLSGGSATITSTAIDVNTVIVMSVKTMSGTVGDHLPSVSVAAGSATIDGSSSDDSTYNWVALKVN